MSTEAIFTSSMVFIVFIVAILAIYYLLSRRNMKKQYKHFEQLHQNLQVGKRVLCAQGIYGTVKRIDDDKVDVEIAKGIQITVSRYAISEIVD